MKDVRDALMIGTSTDGKLVKRPLSPHLQVYRPQITSVLSILNRMCALATSVGTLLMVWWLVAASMGPVAFARVQWFVGSPIGLFVLAGWTLCLFYHLFQGLRHLAWDAGWGYELDRTYFSGWLTVIATIATTTLVWVVGLFLIRG
jgi:succinate dehydrogenase / fumarate reductase cytochrome b subunit